MKMLYCPDATPAFFGIFDFSIAPTLLYYSYIPIIIIVLVMSFFILRVDKNSLQSKLFAALALSFTAWVVSTILQWIAAPVALVMFSWQLLVTFEIATFIFATYFLYVFIHKKDLPKYAKSILAISALPVIILMPTFMNVEGFDIMSCEGWVHTYTFNYSYILDALMIAAASFIGVYSYIKREELELQNHRIIAASVGTVFFMTIFFLTSLFGDILFGYEIELIGPTGMVIFLALMVYLMVKFKAFGSKLIATEAFVGTLLVLIAAMFFIQSIEMVRIITGATLVLSLGLGFFLIRSVRREIEQRKEIELLAIKLEKANKRLKILDKMKSEFVSIASHQLRSPLTSIRGYASMLLEGSFGKLSAKAQDAVERIAESSHYMATSVEDYLNVSRIQAGNMKYEYSDFNLKDKAEQIADDIRPQAIRKGLSLTFKSELDFQGIVNADIGKTQQIIHNLVNNALKYTPKGSVRIQVRDKKRPKKIFVDVVDTGIGMGPETVEAMFDKFERAENANSVNVSGTGLGLYIARKMAQEMGGDVYAKSEGEGKGSIFTLELPLQM